VFAIHGNSVYFASEFKQYSLDTAVALGITAILLRWGELDFDRVSTRWMGLAAALSVWFSLPSSLVVGPGLAWYWLTTWGKGRHTPFRRVSGVLCAWALSLLVYLVLVLLPTIGSGFLRGYWEPGFLPVTSVGEAFSWILHSPRRVMLWPMGLHDSGIALVLLAAGVVWFVLHRRQMAVALLAPILAAFLAGVFHLYPFGGYGGRTILFLVPYLSIFLVAPLGWVPTKREERWLFLSMVTLSLAVLLFPSLKATVSQLRDGIQREELWPVIQEVRPFLEGEDRVYLYHGARSPFLYYGRRLDLPPDQVLLGQPPGPGEELPPELPSLLGSGRVWVIASWGCAGSEEGADAIAIFLRQHGRQLADLRKPGAVAYLFDLSAQPIR
jgi:hypothetical protein